VPTFRADVVGIGDAAGDSRLYADVSQFYTPDRERLVEAIVDSLAARGLGPRFVLIGLCAGAYSAFNAAAIDPRIGTAIVINPRVLVWDPELLARRDARMVTRVLKRDSWQRILSGETTPAAVAAIGRTAVVQASRAVVRAPGRLRTKSQADINAERVAGLLDRLQAAGTRTVLAFSGDEPVHDELASGGILGQLERWPAVVVEPLPGFDHTLRPLPAQHACHRLLERELERIIEEPA